MLSEKQLDSCTTELIPQSTNNALTLWRSTCTALTQPDAEPVHRRLRGTISAILNKFFQEELTERPICSQLSNSTLMIERTTVTRPGASFPIETGYESSTGPTTLKRLRTLSSPTAILTLGDQEESPTTSDTISPLLSFTVELITTTSEDRTAGTRKTS